MRFAIATDNEKEIAAHTGRCRGFVIYDETDGHASRVAYRANAYTSHSLGKCTGGKGHHSPEGHHSHGPLLDALSDCQALVTQGMGFRLVADLRDRGIIPHVCGAASVEEAADLFARRQLPQVEGLGTCSHARGEHA